MVDLANKRRPMPLFTEDLFHNYLRVRIPIPKGKKTHDHRSRTGNPHHHPDRQGNRQGRCEGCPRCDEPASGFCKIPHPKYQNRHPVCKVCGHCVLRGNHMDDASDLDEHPGLGSRACRTGPKPQLTGMTPPRPKPRPPTKTRVPSRPRCYQGFEAIPQFKSQSSASRSSRTWPMTWNR